MRILRGRSRRDLEDKLEKLFDELWPLHRSLTGTGYRQSLRILSRWMPLRVLKFRSGSKIFDWIVPPEWSVKEAYFIGPNGQRRADVKKNNLHLLAYSSPFCGRVSLEKLKQHLHTRPDLPEAIPYVTSYYQKTWGFSLSHQEYQSLESGSYQVVIKTSFKKGTVDLGEAVISGKTCQEILFTSYLCHPSMANNELSGPLTLACLYRLLKQKPIPNFRYTLRFLLNPETIGSLCYLKRREKQLQARLVGGFVVSCVGMNAPLSMKSSKLGSSPLETIARELVKKNKGKVRPFGPSGSDDRQYGSPGFNLPIGILSRAFDFDFPEYHTCWDNKKCLSFGKIIEAAELIYEALIRLNNWKIFKGKILKGEPFLTKYQLYPTISRGHARETGLSPLQTAVKWVLNQSDGKTDLREIAKKSNLRIYLLEKAVRLLKRKGLLY